MSGETSRISKSFPVFIPYIIATNSRQLDTNPDTSNPWWTDYGWTSAQSAQWDSTTSQAFDLYAAYSNPSTRTSVVRQNLVDLINDFIEYVNDNTLFDKIIASTVVTNTDAAIFNFDLHPSDPTHLNSKIETVPVPSVKSTGPGVVDVQCRTASDASRASIDRMHGADAVEHAIAIFDHAPTEEESNDPDNRQYFSKGVSKKAHFPMDLGAGNRRKIMVGYFRWVNLSYPQFAGDWSEMVSVIIG